MTNSENAYGHSVGGKTPQWAAQVESPALGDFIQTMTPRCKGQPALKGEQASGGKLITPLNSRSMTRSDRRMPKRLNLDREKTKNGLAQLVLTVVKLLHELLEKQALRRIDGGGLTDAEVERLGFTLMRQSEEITRIGSEFGLDEDDLNLDLGPLGKLL
jgi:hypothetical protein